MIHYTKHIKYNTAPFKQECWKIKIYSFISLYQLLMSLSNIFLGNLKCFTQIISISY